MTDKEEKLLSQALKYGLIFMLALTSPIWAPIIALGAFCCFPFFLIYMFIDEYEQDKKEHENEEFHQ